jgi:dCTP deaminase
MILSDREIQLALENRLISVEPSPGLEAYSSTSVDLRLSPRITVFKNELAGDGVELVIDPGGPNFVAETIIGRVSDNIDMGEDGYLLPPRRLVLGWTIEKLTLPFQSKLAARVEGKSSLARLGLGIHITAPTIHSGFSYPIRLEMVNHGYVPIRLRPRMRICQLIFELTLGTPEKGFVPKHSAPTPAAAAR